MLGEFEYLVMAAAARLGADAYGATIRLAVEGCTGRGCSIGALYTTLDRLEAKGYIKTRMGEATAERGGRAKRMVQVTREGAKAATHFYTTVVQATRGTSWEMLKAGTQP
jgi:PadR family transcriptional regulator PadR